MGFRPFSVPGKEKAEAEWKLASLSLSLWRMAYLCSQEMYEMYKIPAEALANAYAQRSAHRALLDNECQQHAWSPIPINKTRFARLCRADSSPPSAARRIIKAIIVKAIQAYAICSIQSNAQNINLTAATSRKIRLLFREGLCVHAP